MLDTITLDTIRTMRSNGSDGEDIAMAVGIPSARGANMFALIFPTVVVKWPSTDAPFHAAAGTDAKFYASVEMQDRQHFAQSSQEGDLIVQERCVMLYDMTVKFAEMTHSQQKATILIWLDMALRYNLYDLHEYNVGFRMNDDTFSTPVIFDYSGQKNLSGVYAMDGSDRVEGYLNLPCWLCHEPAEIRRAIREAIDAFYADN